MSGAPTARTWRRGSDFATGHEYPEHVGDSRHSIFDDGGEKGQQPLIRIGSWPEWHSDFA